MNRRGGAPFTGGPLLHGSTERPDLPNAENTLTLATAQRASAARRKQA